MQRTLIRLFRILPLGVLYGCMALVIPFYMLFAKGFKASYNFYRKRMGYGPVKSFFYVYKNEFAFGQVVLDRFAAYAGKKFDMEVPRMDLFRELCAGEDGFVQLSSHVGNYEMVGYSLVSPKPINALVFAGETATVMQNRALLFGATNVRMVPVSEDLSHIFSLNNALADGEIASLPGDRVFGSKKTVLCPFFGEPAPFPAGPFTLAAQRGAPVLLVFVMKEACNSWPMPTPPPWKRWSASIRTSGTTSLISGNEPVRRNSRPRNPAAARTLRVRGPARPL